MSAGAPVRLDIASETWHRLARLGVAVSGGGDSMALLHLLVDAAAPHGVTLEAATVDHGLRPEAAEEAAFVARACAGLGIRHDILRWQGWDGSGNLQAEARAARYRLLARWAQDRGLDRVALGHTADDQAETFLMRLGREAGVDGLAAMARDFDRDGARFWRPALSLTRAALRAWLTEKGIEWCDDPSNQDPSYDRVRARNALSELQNLGIGVETLAAVSHNLRSAGDALAGFARAAAERGAVVQAGDVVFERAMLAAQPWEIRRRLLSRALAWVANAPYGPRREALADCDRAVFAGHAHTLHGCLVAPRGDTIRIGREYDAVKDLACAPGALWDGRWRLTGPGDGVTIRALGAAVADCPGWREMDLPRASLMASPAVWCENSLVAAPLAGLANGWSAEINHPKGEFITSLNSH